MEELLDSHTGVLHVLENALPGLIKRESVYNILLESIENVNLKKQLMELDVDREITELTIDQDKSVILSMLLGNKFTSAIDLVFNSEITGVFSDMTITPVVKRDVNQLLSKLGLVWKRLQLIHRDKGIPVHVDMTNWYCECQEYQLNYINDMELIKVIGNSYLEKLLGDMKSNCLSPIPICKHIISILIIKFNSDMF
ncbi:hypothetical protein SBY92_003436 [Candida maltosa Xu316]